MVERGEDAAAEKAEGKRRTPDTVRRVGQPFVEKWHRPRNRTADEITRMLEIHVYPQIGDREIKTITRRDLLDLLDKAEERRQGAGLNRLHANLRRMFAWAAERDIIPSSPADGIKRPALATGCDRVLSDDELRAFLRACGRLGDPFGPLVHLVLLTAQRRDEVAGMRWAEIKSSEWHLPAERMKNNRAHVVPLAEQAIAILEGRPRRGAFVFPSPSPEPETTSPGPSPALAARSSGSTP
jgi:integrase